MADKLSNQQIDELIAKSVDDILDKNTMDTIKIDDPAIGQLVDTAQRLNAFSQNYPGSKGMQQRAIQIKQAYRAEIKNKPSSSRASKQKGFSFMRRPNTFFGALSTLAIVLAIVTAVAQNLGGSGLAATATSSTWVVPAIVGTLVVITGIAYWFSKK